MDTFQESASWDATDELLGALQLPPALILPSQFRPEASWSPEQRLMFAVLEGAIRDLQMTRCSLRAFTAGDPHPRWMSMTEYAHSSSKVWHLQARFWFEFPQTGEISLRMVCEAFDLRIEDVQRWARQVTHGEGNA